MGYQELIEALRRDGEEQVETIRSDAETEAARLKAEVSVRISRLREEYEARRSVAEAIQARAILAEAESRGALIILGAENALAERLYVLATNALDSFRDGGYGRLFADLVGELPDCSWRRVVVNPADKALAAHHFPAAETVVDPSIAGGGKFRPVPLSFIGPRGFVKWVADSDPGQGRNHVNFALDEAGESLLVYRISGSNYVPLHGVGFGAQSADVSQGSLPDGLPGYPGAFLAASRYV